MRHHDQHVREHHTHWQFSTRDDVLERACPNTRRRVAAAGAGIFCAITLYSWAVPPMKQTKAGASERTSVTRIVPDALRALTGFASSSQPGSAQRASTASGAGIRN